MARAEIGNRVLVYYKGVLEDGTVAEGTAEGEPYEFTVGDEAVKRHLYAPCSRHGRRRFPRRSSCRPKRRLVRIIPIL